MVGGQILLPAIGFKDQRPYQGVMLPHESRSFPSGVRMIPTAERSGHELRGITSAERFPARVTNC